MQDAKNIHPFDDEPLDPDQLLVELRSTRKLLSAVLAKVGPVILTRPEYEGADPRDLASKTGGLDEPIVFANVQQFDADGEPHPSVGYMPVDADHEPPADVRYALDRHDRVLVGIQYPRARLWSQVAQPNQPAEPWGFHWTQAGPLRPLVAAYPPGVNR